MIRIGLATVPAIIREVAGVAISYTSIFFRLLLQDDDGGGNPPDSIIDWLIRALIALLKIIAKIPKTGDDFPNFSELLVILFGENFAEAIENSLRTITNVPEIFEGAQSIIGFLYVVLVVAMFLGIVTYWRAYSAQSEGGYSRIERIWSNQTLIVDPLSWFLKRLFPFCIILAVPLWLTSQMIRIIWEVLYFLIDYGYGAAGTTFAGSIEDFLFTVAEQGGIGVWGLYLLFILLMITLIWTGWKFAVRLLKFFLANFVAAFNLGLWLDGSKLRSVAGPFSTWLKALLELAGMVLILYAIPLIIGSLPEIWAFFFLLLGLLFAAQYKEWIREWFGGEAGLSMSVGQILNPTWIDDIEARPTRGPVELHVQDITDRASSAARGAGGAVMGAADAALMTVSPKYRVARTVWKAGQRILGRDTGESPAYQRGQQFVNRVQGGIKEIRKAGEGLDQDIKLAEALRGLSWFRPGFAQTLDDQARVFLLARIADKEKLTGNCTQCGASLPEEGVVCGYCGTPNITPERADGLVDQEFATLSSEQRREYGKRGVKITKNLRSQFFGGEW